MKRKCVVSMVLCLFAALLPLTGQAETVDPERSCALTVELLDGGAPVKGFPFALYYVAAVSAQGEFSLSGDFQNVPAEVNGLTQGQYADLARLLDAYVRQDKRIPLDRKTTGADGRASFAELRPGLYLVGGSAVSLSGRSIETGPFLVSLPSRSASGNLTYQVTANPKHITSEPSQTLTRRVLKLWQGDEAGLRPREITVYLLKDGEVYDAQTLWAGNNWQYLWKNLPAEDSAGRPYIWTLREQAVDGYKSTVWTEGNIILVRNTYLGKKLPQTGQSWSGVWVLSAAGGVLLTLSLLPKKRKD